MSENVQNKAFFFTTSSIAHIACIEFVLLMSDTYVNSLYTCQRCLLGQCVGVLFFRFVDYECVGDSVLICKRQHVSYTC